ncbi:MAG: hypothetical protein II784_04560, partial [Oscillospiraceae bacterium]|nr:hypothetical protein [Oscillospiraceae bacterium]
MALKDFRAMMERDSYCNSCKWIPYDKIRSQRFAENCPTNLYYQFHLYSVRGKWQAAQTYLDTQEGTLGKDPLIKQYGYDFNSSPDFLESVQSCTTCGSCDVSCKVCRFNLEPLAFNIELKNEAILRGFVLPQQKEAIEALKKEQT